MTAKQRKALVQPAQLVKLGFTRAGRGTYQLCYDKLVIMAEYNGDGYVDLSATALHRAVEYQIPDMVRVSCLRELLPAIIKLTRESESGRS